MRISDFREINSIKIGIDNFAGPSGSWDMDIWLTTQRNTTGFDMVQRLKQELTEENRKIIMNLKHHFYKKGMLRDGMSKKIYLAVIEKDIKTVEEFESYLHSN